MAGEQRTRKLKWLCRRGMKELDILLERFIADHQQDLSEGKWPQFEALLRLEDDVLWDALQDPGTAPSDSFTPLLEHIRLPHA